MNTSNAYSEILNWFNGDRNLNAGMKLHTRYSKNHANKMRLAKGIGNRKRLLETYLQEILNSHKPKSEPIFENKKNQSETTETKFKKTFQQRLEQEFPKLKFSDLPDKLKLLVFKRFDAWEKSKQYHAEQHQAETNEERFEAAAKTVRAIMENWGIWEELDHFHTNGKILGKHPDFEKNEFDEWIIEMERKPVLEYTKEFQKVRKNARNNISRMLQIAKKQELTDKQQQIIDTWIYKHDIVSVKINEPVWADSKND